MAPISTNSGVASTAKPATGGTSVSHDYIHAEHYQQPQPQQSSFEAEHVEPP